MWHLSGGRELWHVMPRAGEQIRWGQGGDKGEEGCEPPKESSGWMFA